jgi:hypothetical protein
MDKMAALPPELMDKTGLFEKHNKFDQCKNEKGFAALRDEEK